MKIVFMGTPKAAVPSLEYILREGHQVLAVYAQPDRPSGRGNKISFSPVKEFALSHDLSVFQPQKIRTPEALEIFRSHNADVAVVVAYGRILPGTFLTAYPEGALNVHFSLLPKYRGAAPVNWAIVNGETETGVTTMRMDEGLDTGDVYLQRTEPIRPDEDSVELMDRLSFVGAELLSETLRNLDRLKPLQQNDSDATLAPLMKKDDGLIDWKMAAGEISNRVRGFQPFPTAHTVYQGKKLTLWRTTTGGIIPSVSASAGEVLEANGDILTVACGAGSTIGIHELQLEGKRRMATRDLLNGINIHSGEILG